MYLTDSDIAEIEDDREREADLFRAVLAGENGMRAYLANDGVLAPTGEQIGDFVEDAIAALDDAESVARIFGERPAFDLDAVRVHLDKLRGLVPVAA